jgi:transketolase
MQDLIPPIKATKFELIATRQAFGEALYEVMKENKSVVALTADLGESLRMLKIQEEMPERFFDIGVAEANMAGIAAGLALGGFVPVAGTFAVFMTRAFDHIRMQICQNNLHAVMVGSHGGVSNALDGGSAHALEDIAYMRALPNITIIYPVDANQTAQAFRAAAMLDGPVYLRLYREATPVFTGKDDVFKIGQANIHRAGNDVSIVAAGPSTAMALTACEQLKISGINAEVIGVHTIKPLDKETIIKSAQKTKRVVTVEDHNINGGLGSAVAEVLGEEQPTLLRRVGVTQFGESGTYPQLTARLGIDAAGIVRAVQQIVKN